MLVKMLSTRKGAPDNVNTQTYFQGHQYEIHGELLDVFLREGWCEATEPFREGEGNGEKSKPLADTGSSGSSDTSNVGKESAPLADTTGSTEQSNSDGTEGGASTGGGSGEQELVLAEADVLA